MTPPTIVGTPTATRYGNPLSNTIGTGANYSIGTIRGAVGSMTATRSTVGAMDVIQDYNFNGGVDYITLFGQADPTAGAQDFTAGLASNGKAMCSADNVDTADPWGTPVTNDGSSTSPTVTITSDTNALGVAVIAYRGTGTTVTAGTDETVVIQYTEDGRGIAILTKAGATSVSFAPTLSGATEWGIIGASLNGTSAPGGLSIPIATDYYTLTLG